MSKMTSDPFNARTRLAGSSEPIVYYRLAALEEAGVGQISRLPFSIKVLLEALLRQIDGFAVTEEDVVRLANWDAANPAPVELPFKPARVVMQDFTGVPGVVDLAAMRSAMARLGGDPKRVNPLIPVDLVIDHSVQVDQFGSAFALFYNAEREFERNRERYEFLKWGQQSFDNFRVVPPATGIVHQVNLEYLASVVQVTDEGRTTKDENASSWSLVTRRLRVAYPDTVVGTDSHTTMINGLGVLGWGVGGIEAEAVMLGQPIYMLTPQVVGFRLTGELPEGATATDLVLTVTQMLRAKGVVDKFVEFYGPGVGKLSLPDRATIANMAPDYGATMGFFPVDAETLRYLALSGRSGELVDLVERYSKAQGLFRTDETPDPVFTDTLELDMRTVVPSLAGPKRPQDLVALAGGVKNSFRKAFPDASSRITHHASRNPSATSCDLEDGSVVLAAITSCTNTSNPSVMVGAGLLAKKAAEKGLQARPWVKTSLAPGSKVVTRYLDAAGLTPYLEAVGFYTVGYGCTTCIGNSGPLAEEAGAAVKERNLTVAAVISGNRNFEGRVHPQVRANYLASPPLVVAYALAGTVDIDLTAEPLGADRDGNPVFLRDIWPSSAEIQDTIAGSLNAEMYRGEYANVFGGNPTWNAIPVAGGDLFPWDNAHSTYIHEPPFFVDLAPEPAAPQDIRGRARSGVSGRQHHHRSHLAGRQHRGGQPGGTLSDRARRAGQRVQPIRRAARQPRGPDARHLRQHPHQEQAGAGSGRWVHSLPWGGRRTKDEGRNRFVVGRWSFVRRAADLRRGDEIPGGRHPDHHPRRQGIRHRLQPRLGGQGAEAAGRQGRDRRELRAHPSQQPGGDGRAAAPVPARTKR